MKYKIIGAALISIVSMNVTLAQSAYQLQKQENQMLNDNAAGNYIRGLRREFAEQQRKEQMAIAKSRSRKNINKSHPHNAGGQRWQQTQKQAQPWTNNNSNQLKPWTTQQHNPWAGPAPKQQPKPRNTNPDNIFAPNSASKIFQDNNGQNNNNQKQNQPINIFRN